METLVAFAVILIFITILTAKYHLPPFLTLIAAAFIYGILTGMGETVVTSMTSGAGSIFALLGIPIYCGAVIAQSLKYGGGIERILADLRRVLKRPALASGFAGYLLSIPLMCCFTSLIVLLPLLERLKSWKDGGNNVIYMAALGSIFSFVLIFPLPVVYSIITKSGITGFDATEFTIIAVPISLLLLLLVNRATRNNTTANGNIEQPSGDFHGIARWKAWGPVCIPVILICTGHLFAPLSILSNINVALLAGLIVALISVNHEVRTTALEKGTKNAGIILFDLCGAGALGHVIAASAFADQVYAGIAGFLPACLLPFILAAMIQTAQGSRVVTAVITASILTGTAIVSTIPVIPFILMISAGTLIFSYVSDPYFWLVKRATGDSIATVLKKYTLPQAGAAFIVLAFALAILQFG